MRDEIISRPVKRQSSEPLFGVLTGSLANMLPDWFAAKARRDVWRCGFLHPQAYENYLALRNFLFCAVVLSLFCWLLALEQDSFWTMRIGIGGSVLALCLFALPRIVISLLGEARAKRVVFALPDGLDLVAMAMSGGVPFHRSLELTVDQLQPAHPDLANEFALIAKQTNAGSLQYALQRFAQRIDMQEVTTVVESLLQAIQLGSPLQNIFENLADRMRQDRMQRATGQSNKNALKMLFPTVLFLAPAAFIIILMPPLLKLKEFQNDANQEGAVLKQSDLQESMEKRGTVRKE